MKRLVCFVAVTAVLSQHTFFPLQLSVIEIVSRNISKQEVANDNKIAQRYVPRVAQSAVSKRNEFDSIIFVGDVLLARNVEFLMRTRNATYPFAGFDFTSVGDSPAVVGNFEAAVPREHQPTPIRQIDFSVATWTLPYAADAGFTHFSLANNHSYDFGAAEFLNTIEVLNVDFSVFGHPNKVMQTAFNIIELDAKKVGLVALNALGPLDQAGLLSIMEKAEVETDKQIVYVHWGTEYDQEHNSSQRVLAEFLIEAGADLIIGHHPHVVQDVDLINGVTVFYSLGNYIFDQYFSPEVQEGLVLALHHSPELGLSLLPVSSHQTLSQPRALEAENHRTFLDSLAKRSHPELHEFITEGYIPLTLELETSEKIAMMQRTNSYVQ